MTLAESKQLLRKYNVPAPRYTSYPTVPYWDSTPSTEQWLNLWSDARSKAEQHGRGVALYIHIPFCEKLCTFCGCNTRITKNHDVSLPYIEVVHEEWRLYHDALGLTHPMTVSDIHLGGGTPTFLSVSELRKLLEPLLASVRVDGTAEFSVEIDPRVTSRDQLKALVDMGFAQLSVGVQDFDVTVQEAVNRIQPFAVVESCIAAARDAGFRNISFDLIYGLPFQTERGMCDTFEKVIQLKPDKVAFFPYAHVPWIKPAHRKFSEQDLPDPELKRRLYELGRDALEAGGYKEIGIDHFALANDPLWQAASDGNLHRNFMGYVAKPRSPLLGLGVSSISDSWSAFIQNEKTLEAYRARVLDGKIPILRGHVLTDEDRSLRGHILNLITKLETTWSVDSDPARAILIEVTDRLEGMERDGLIDLGADSVRIKDAGRAFIRNVAMAFDARLIRRLSQPGHRS